MDYSSRDGRALRVGWTDAFGQPWAVVAAYAPNDATEQAALGRVVVYRNGIAYYERRAHVEGDKLTLNVPADKVDDFLKSLTVADAKSGAALPIAFPSAPTVRKQGGQDVAMEIQLPDRSPRDLVLSYVTESPAWKPSYRVLVSDDGKVDLQGWAIVDNTSGEDWRSVQVGVGSSSALSFRFDLHNIRTVHRETLHSQDSFAKAPPVGGSVVAQREAPRDAVLAQLDDDDIPRPEGHPRDARIAAGIAMEAEMAPSKGMVARSAPAARPAPAAAPMRDEGMSAPKVAALAESLKRQGQPVVIEGFAQPGEPEAQDRAVDRANLLRNQLIEQGVPPTQVRAIGRGVVAGQRAGVRLVADKSAPQASGGELAEVGPPVGESHFESKSPMSVAKGTSAMVSMLQTKAEGDIVYLYDAESGRGDARHAFRAVRFKNPTASMLDTGPMTVYGSGRFIGEGLTEPIPAGAVAVVPFALDRQVVVDRDGSTGDRIATLIKVQRGVMTAEVLHWRKTKLKLTNRLPTRQLVLVRHTVPKGWQLTQSPKVAELLGEARLFQVMLNGGESQTLEIEEATPLQKTLDLRSDVCVDLMRLWLDAGQAEPAVAERLKRLLAYHQEMAKADETINHLRQRGDEFRVRLDELQAAFLRVKLAHLDRWNERRRVLAARYDDRLAGVPGLGLPRAPQWAEPVWHLYVVRTDRRAELVAALDKAVQQVTYASQIIGRVREYTQSRQPKTEPLDLVERHRTAAAEQGLRIPTGRIQDVDLIQGGVLAGTCHAPGNQRALARLPGTGDDHGRHHPQALDQGLLDQSGEGFHDVDDNHSRRG